MECKVIIDNNDFSFDVEGDFHEGNDEVLFNNSPLARHPTLINETGFGIFDILDESAFSKLHDSIETNLINAIEKSLGVREYEGGIENYHQVVKTNEDHNKVTSITKNLKNEDFDFDLDSIAEKIGTVLNLKLSSQNPVLGRTHVQLRISRPENMDINPPHKDAYLPYYENVLNLWLPIAGCNERSILPLSSGSHLFNEKDLQLTPAQNAVINGNLYTVPCILSHLGKPFDMFRPNVKYGQAIVFTPYLIHGAAINLGDKTRLALELRLTIEE